MPARFKSPTSLRHRSFFMLLAVIVMLAGCQESGSDEDAAATDTTAVAEDEAKPAKKEKAIKVNTGLVVSGDLVESIFADGEIRTPRMLEVRTKITGQLVEVLVRDGDRVKKNQLLARIDAREFRLDLQKSRYDHLQALSQIAAEQDTFELNLEAVRDFETRRADLDRLYERGNLGDTEYQARILQLEMEAL